MAIICIYVFLAVDITLNTLLLAIEIKKTKKQKEAKENEKE